MSIHSPTVPAQRALAWGGGFGFGGCGFGCGGCGGGICGGGFFDGCGGGFGCGGYPDYGGHCQLPRLQK